VHLNCGLAEGFIPTGEREREVMGERERDVMERGFIPTGKRGSLHYIQGITYRALSELHRALSTMYRAPFHIA